MDLTAFLALPPLPTSLTPTRPAPIPAPIPPAPAPVGVLMSGPFRGQAASMQSGTGMVTWQDNQPTPASIQFTQPTIDMGAPAFWNDGETPATQGISFSSDGYSFDSDLGDVQFEPEPEGQRRRQYDGPGARRQASRTVVADRGVGGGGSVVSQLNPATGRFEQLPRPAIRRNDNPPPPIYPQYEPEDRNANSKMVRRPSPQQSDLSRCATDIILEF